MPELLDVAIIGAGFSGIGLGVALKKAGVENFAILEKGADVGGVWRENVYPGACCDVPANLYSFSFAPKADWTRRYPPQPEIHAYLRECARRHSLDAHLRFRTEVTSAAFDESAACWGLVTAAGETVRARALVSAVGQLSRPAWPKLEGAERFRGTTFHSAQWDHACDPRGKRVAVVGTGASAVQFIPKLAAQASELYVLQRSAPWVIPKWDRRYGALSRVLFRFVPGWQRLCRAFWYCLGELTCAVFFEGSRTAPFFRALSRWHLQRQVKDSALRERLTPATPLGCQRVLFSNDYFPALARPNVHVVTEAIHELAERGVVLADGRTLEVDVIVYGTGFRATEFLAPMRITGLGGRELNDAWRGGAEAYLGMTVAGFPNCFLLYGPNTNLGSNSIVFMIECQVRYVLRCLDELRRGVRSLDVREDVLRRWNDSLQARLARSVWSAGCRSWYRDAGGRVTTNWPGPTRDYARLTARVRLEDFRVVG
jgi:cation diffusion facilitator CzcD-associated flavoprotein CzcO